MKNAKILVVDDDAVVLASCQRVLEEEGCRSVLVANADEALAALAGDGFDLLLVDVKMPGPDGIWLLRQIKERWPEIPVLVMSGYPTPETIGEGLESGASGFFAKPFTPEELLASVREALEKE